MCAACCVLFEQLPHIKPAVGRCQKQTISCCVIKENSGKKCDLILSTVFQASRKGLEEQMNCFLIGLYLSFILLKQEVVDGVGKFERYETGKSFCIL